MEMVACATISIKGTNYKIPTIYMSNHITVQNDLPNMSVGCMSHQSTRWTEGGNVQFDELAEDEQTMLTLTSHPSNILPCPI